MSKYNIFLAIFILSVLAFISFFIFYLQAIFGFMHSMIGLNGDEPNPFFMLSQIFSPGVVISGIILVITSLVYRILGIVHVVQNNHAKDGEKALWIIGFVIMGFVTAIVFLVMARGRKFVE